MKLWKVLARNSHVYRSTSSKCQTSNDEMFELKSISPTYSHDSGKDSDSFPNHDSGLLVTMVQLRKKTGESLGITLAKSNSEVDQCPSIASLRPGSVALISDQLIPGDRICSVNGITTLRMRPEDVTTLLDNIDGNALLEIEYNLPTYASQNSICITSKVSDVAVTRIDGSLGITLRGGCTNDHPHASTRPLVITHIRPNGPAHQTGLIRVGDRLVKVDHQVLANKTLMEAQQILCDMSHSITTLTIEYDVSIMESVKYANGPLLVEIDRQIEEDFGLILTNCCSFERDEIVSSGYFVEHIVPASTADRCGALSIGDQLLAIDDVLLETWNGRHSDAERLLRRATKLQILPFITRQRSISRNYAGQYGNSPSLTGYSTINSKRSRNQHRNRYSSLHNSLNAGDSNSIYCGGCSSSSRGVCHPESLKVVLTADGNTFTGYGLTVSVSEHLDDHSADILITRIIPDSPAYRCGCLQVGDRILSVNHQSNLTLQETNSLLDIANGNYNRISLQVEFDVADTIVPSSGIFTVKLAKRGPRLGITLTASKIRPEEPFIISEIQKGSIAHRTGTLHAGDRLLAIDNRMLDHLSLESAFEILQNSTKDIVTLKIEKTETENSNLFLDSIVYTVELHRYGGPLGITISGSEDCVDPIVLSRLTEGGLAEKTGALHVGDRILAINGENLEHRPLSDAINLLQSAGDRVQIKIARKPEEPSLEEVRCNYSSPVISTDSAIHSWDSNVQESSTFDLLETKDETESILNQFDDQLLKSCISKPRNSHLQFYSDGEENFCPSPLPLPNFNLGGSNNDCQMYLPAASSNSTTSDRLRGTYSHESIIDNEIYHVTLYKDSIYDDYGFSVSDGLYERGVYVNRIRKGGPADIVGLLKPYDRIIQVNDTRTVDFDCCLTVPLIASAGDRIELVVARNPFINYTDKGMQNNLSKRSFSTSQHTITKTI